MIERIHAYVRASRHLGFGAAVPSESPPPEMKEYERMPRIPLPAPVRVECPLSDSLALRTSLRDCTNARLFSVAEIGTLLGTALGTRADDWSRQYPSAGALFPVETYLIGECIAGYPSSAFHYHPKAHALEYLWDIPGSDVARVVTGTITPRTPVVVILTALWGRSSAKYGDFAYSHALMEAGHMAQNILLVGGALGIGTRPFAAFDDALVSELLDLRDGEQPVYGVLLCAGARTVGDRPIIDE